MEYEGLSRRFGKIFTIEENEGQILKTITNGKYLFVALQKKVMVYNIDKGIITQQLFSSTGISDMEFISKSNKLVLALENNTLVSYEFANKQLSEDPVDFTPEDLTKIDIGVISKLRYFEDYNVLVNHLLYFLVYHRSRHVYERLWGIRKASAHL